MKYEVKDLNTPSRWNMRIWDDDKKEWLCQSDKEALTYYGFDITGGETTEFQGLPKWHPDRHLIWEQSTGLKDKNCKEIYEGDVVEGDMGVFDVEWYDVVARFMFTPNTDMKWHPPFVSDQVEEMEVIGNIHENPELVGGRK